MTTPLLVALLLVTAVTDGELLYLEANEARADGDVQLALDLYRDVVELHPDDPFAPSALLVWADIEAERGDLHVAETLYRKLEQDYPTHRLARTARDHREKLEQRRALDSVELQYQELLEGYTELGPKETVLAVEALIDANPDHHLVPRAECWLGNQYRQMARFDRSVERYRRSLEANSRSECGRRSLDAIGNIALNKRKPRVARKAFRALIDYGKVGEANMEHNMRAWRRLVVVVRCWQVLWIGSAAGLLALAVGLPWRKLRAKRLLHGLLHAAMAAALLFAVGAIFTSIRGPLVLATGGIAAAAFLQGLTQGLPGPRWYDRLRPILLVWLCLTSLYGAVYILDWI